MRTVAAIPAAGLVTGSALGLLAPDCPRAPFIVLLCACAMFAVWTWFRSRTWLFGAAIVLAFFAGGAVLAIDAGARAWRPSLRAHFEQWPSETVLLTGVLLGDASPRDRSVSVRLASRSVRRTALPAAPDGAIDIPVEGGVLLTIVGDLAHERIGDWRAGRTIQAPVELRRPSRYLNPGVADEERAMARRGITLVGTVKSGALVDVIAKGSIASEQAGRIRAAVRRTVQAAVGHWSEQSAAIVTAILIGDRAGLGEPLTRRLQEAGTYHVIAISGGNIAILAGLVLAAFRFGRVLGPPAMVAAIGGLIAYCYVVGGGASVTRATIMATLFFAARAMDLRAPPLNSLALVAALLVAAAPLAVADAGLLLTCGATAGILVAVPLVPVRRLPRLAVPVVVMFAASLAAEAVLLPIGARLFSRVTFAGLIVNFAAIPLMAGVQVAGMALLAAATVSAAGAHWVGWVAHIAAEGLVRSADFVELVPAVTWRVSPPHWAAVALYYLALASGWAIWRSRRSRAALRGAAATALSAAVWILAEPWTFVAARADGLLRVTFLDVGQGDAALVRFPSGESWVVDAGGLPASSTYDIGDRIIGPVLRHFGVRRLDTVAVTHGDADHLSGAPTVLREFRPRDVWEGVPVPRFEPLRGLKHVTRDVGARWVNVQANDMVTVGDARIVVRHPPVADWERQDVRNDDSIVLEILWGDVSVVLTGDIGRDVEGAIAASFAPSPLRVVKVPHHGSRTSSTPAFIEALAPKVAVVSAGRNNPFGHPVPEVLERYARAGAEVFRTDRDGAVTVTSDGAGLTVTTFVQNTKTTKDTKDTKYTRGETHAPSAYAVGR